MKIRTKFTPSSIDSRALMDLNELIKEETNISTKLDTRNIEGAKGDLIIGIQIATLALASITALITVLTYWNNRKPEYSITLNIGNNSYKRENMNKEDFEKELKKATEDTTSNIEISYKFDGE